MVPGIPRRRYVTTTTFQTRIKKLSVRKERRGVLINSHDIRAGGSIFARHANDAGTGANANTFGASVPSLYACIIGLDEVVKVRALVIVIVHLILAKRNLPNR